MPSIIHYYKVFHNEDGVPTCEGVQYPLNEVVIHEGEIIMCEKGLHFCLDPASTSHYYKWTSNNYANADKFLFGEVEVPNGATTEIEGGKGVTNQLKLVKLYNPEEWKEMCTLVVNYNGNQKQYYKGRFHSNDDQPAIVRANGKREWWQNGKQHRNNNHPAVIHADGTKEWWQNGKHHRDNDQPAIIHNDGTQEWWLNHKLHRDNDKPAIIHAYGKKMWLRHGKLHRDNDQPAIICADGEREWWQ